MNNPAKKQHHTEKQPYCRTSEGAFAPRWHINLPLVGARIVVHSKENPAIEVAGLPDGKAGAGGLGAFSVRVSNRPRQDWFQCGAAITGGMSSPAGAAAPERKKPQRWVKRRGQADRVATFIEVTGINLSGGRTSQKRKY